MLIEAYLREKKGKNAARRLRKEGLLPAVIYSKRIGSIPIILKQRDVSSLQENMKVELHLNYDKESHKSESYQAVVKEKVYSPLKPLILHVDFQEILLGEEITTVLKLKLEGRAKGEEVGGIPELQISELEIRARVEDIPPFISIDITPLEIGDTFTIRDLKEKYPKLRILEEDTSPIVIISPPEKPEEEEIKEEVVKEPEVIRERKMEYE